MQHIKFMHDIETIVSDYELEEFYDTFKNSKEVHICNNLVLTRFLLGVKRKEIEPFEITVMDFDGTEVNEMCSKDGCLCYAWDTKILSQNLNMTMEIM